MKEKFTFCITITIFLLYPLAVFAQEKNIPNVSVSINPITPSAKNPFTLTLLINYPDPEAVTVIAPPFAALSPERIIKTARVTETQIQTVVEYRFNPNSGGRFTLDSFTVISPDGISETGTFVINIRAENEQQAVIVPRLTWEDVPRQMAAGERVTLTLRVNGWSSMQPPPEFFMPSVPQGVILALSSLSAEERADGIAVKLTLIPITEGDFRLNARAAQYENIRFEIPALQIRITPAVGGSVSAVSADTAELKAQFPYTEERLSILKAENENRRRQKTVIGLLSLIIFLVIFIPFICFLFRRKRGRT